jgi:phosphohistidine phosphatase SixA
VRWHNEERLHSALGYLPPVVVYRGNPEERKGERRRKLAQARPRGKPMKTVVLLRHADIDSPPGPAPDNWPLNAAGRARAEALAHVVGGAGVITVYVSPALRSQQTAAPVAALLGLQPRQVPDTLPQFVQEVLSEPAGVVLVVGHSNTVPEMITALGAPFPGPPIQGHDDLFVVTVVTADTVGAVRLKYGSNAVADGKRGIPGFLLPKSMQKGMAMVSAKAQTASRLKTAGGETTVNLSKLKTVLQSAIADALQRVAQDGGREEPAVEARRGAKVPRPAAEVGVQIQIWEDDPFLEAVAGADPVPAELITVDVPQNTQPLQTQIIEQQPAPEIYPPSSPEFLYWNAASALARGINFWNPLLPGGTQWSTLQQPMPVDVDHKDVEDFNAFYARDSGLNFFHGVVNKVDPPVTVFSGESPDVVCHELGHAILDAVKPELFDAMSIEVAAFHEAFGDMSSMLSALQLPSMRQFVLDQTGGHLNQNSRLSQLARQLGWAIRVQVDPTLVDSDSLRNAANTFFYQDPAGLPPSAPANQLSSEAHSFSRVFSGAFLDVLAGMFQVGPASPHPSDSENLEAISLDAGLLLIEGVRLASVGPGFYSQVAAGMIQADHTLTGSRYSTALSSSFVQRGILSPAAAVSLVRDLRANRGQAFGVTGRATGGRQLQFEGDNEGYKKTGKDVPGLPLRPLTTRFGVTFHVHMPAEPNRFAVAAAALAGGSEKTYSPEEDARSFVEDLIQLDRISHDGAQGVIPAELTALITPGKAAPSAKTHHVVREDGKTILKRLHFDCGFRGCKHCR